MTPTPKHDAEQKSENDPWKPRALLKHIVHDAAHNRFGLELFVIRDDDSTGVRTR